MKLDIGAAAATAWALFRRDRDVLLTIAGAFFFLPTLAALVLLPPPPVRTGPAGDTEAAQQWIKSAFDWYVAGAPVLVTGSVVALYGVLVVATFYADPARPSVGQALIRALTLLPRFTLLMVGVSVAAAIGLALFVLPGLWVLGRTLLVAPVLIAEPGTRQGALARSIALTRGNGLMMAGVAGLGIFGVQLLTGPFEALTATLQGAQAANPVAITLASAVAAAIAAAAALAMALLRVTIYWRAAESSSGI